jgi:hypothetical protein
MNFGDSISIGWCFPRSKPQSFMISVETRPGLVKRHNFMPREDLLPLEDLQECLPISDSILRLSVCREMRDPAKMADGEAQ